LRLIICVAVVGYLTITVKPALVPTSIKK